MRDFCYRCMKAACICEHIIQIQNNIEVVILQHSDEMKHPKNTALLLHLSLANSRIIRGKKFKNTVEKLVSEKNYALVFPDIYHTQKNLKEDNKTKIDGVILIDGTWKKAKKIYFETNVLQSLPKVEIKDRINDYQIRKSPNDNALSTYEAGQSALELLGEKDIKKIEPLFQSFIKQTLSSIEKNKMEKEKK